MLLPDTKLGTCYGKYPFCLLILTCKMRCISYYLANKANMHYFLCNVLYNRSKRASTKYLHYACAALRQNAVATATSTQGVGTADRPAFVWLYNRSKRASTEYLHYACAVLRQNARAKRGLLPSRQSRQACVRMVA